MAPYLLSMKWSGLQGAGTPFGSMRSRGERGLPPVVSMRDSMVQGPGRHTPSVAIQRQPRWSGWGLGEGQEGSSPSAMKRRAFHWRKEGSMPDARHWLGGCNGGAQRPPCQDCGTTPHILRSSEPDACSGYSRT